MGLLVEDLFHAIENVGFAVRQIVQDYDVEGGEGEDVQDCVGADVAEAAGDEDAVGGGTGGVHY